MPSGLVTWAFERGQGAFFGIHNKDNGAKEQQHDKCEERWAVDAHHGEQTRFHGYSFLLGLLDRGQPPESGIAPDIPGGNELTMQPAGYEGGLVSVGGSGGGGDYDSVYPSFEVSPWISVCVCACGVAVEIGWSCPLEQW